MDRTNAKLNKTEKKEVKDIAQKAEKNPQKTNKKNSRRALKSETVANYLTMMNPYAMTVADPFGVRGVRIPDPITTPSSTFSMTQRGSIVQTPASGNTQVALILGTSITTDDQRMYKVGLIPLANSTIPNLNYAVGQIIQNTGGTFSPVAAAAATMVSLVNWRSPTPTIKDLYSDARLVSFGVTLQFTGAPLNASGTLTAVACPVSTLRNSFNTGFTLDQVQNLPGASVSPINDFKGCMARYRPHDNSNWEYVQIDVDSNSTQVDDGPDINNHVPGALILIAAGMPADGWSVQYSITGNYEGIPKTQSVNFVSTDVSRSDPMQLAHATNVIQTLPPAIPSAAAAEVSPPAAGAVASPGAASVGMAVHETPVARTPEHETKLKKANSNPLGMVGSLLEGIPGLLGGLGGALGKVAPLAAAFL